MSSDATRFVPLPDGPVGGRYDVARAIGKGSMGVMFEIFDRVHQKKVALKWLLLDTRAAARSAPVQARASHARGAFEPSLRAPHPIPRALDGLVLGLLSIDPAGRPTTTAEVIDRLSAAVGLDPDPDLSAPRGYLESASIVGRERELRVWGVRCAYLINN